MCVCWSVFLLSPSLALDHFHHASAYHQLLSCCDSHQLNDAPQRPSSAGLYQPHPSLYSYIRLSAQDSLKERAFPGFLRGGGVVGVFKVNQGPYRKL